MIIGTRAQVFHGNADMTSGGLRQSDLKQDKKDGRIKSKAAVTAANRRMKAAIAEAKKRKKAEERTTHPFMIFKTKKGEFKLQPKKGTAAHAKLIKKM